MKTDSSFKDYIVYDVLGHVDGITAKAMFGGWGIYKDGCIVGIIVSGELYLKADTHSMERLTKEGRHPFVYDGHNHKTVTMPYMSVSEEELEQPGLIEERINESYEISKNNTKK